MNIPCRSKSYTESIKVEDVDDIMDGPRQPPDGHEFPDQEKLVELKMPAVEPVNENRSPPPPLKPRESWKSKYEPQVNNVRDKIAIFSKPQTTLTKKYVSTSSIPTDSSTLVKDKDEFRSSTTLFRKNSINDPTPLTPKYRTTASITPVYNTQTSFDSVTLRKKTETPLPRLHSRSVSLLDINDNSNKFNRWNLLIEQRSLSKLKGLVIPEHEPETDGISQPFVDLPEIQSVVTPVITRTETTVKEASIIRRNSSSTSNFQFPQPRPSSDTVTIPKYSPAFKRRSFQIHSSFNTTVPNDPIILQGKNASTNSTTTTVITGDDDDNKADTKAIQPSVKIRDLSNFAVNSISSDPPKSLESITSPTRSDYSFEFNNVPQIKNPNDDLKSTNHREKIIMTRPTSYVSDVIGSSEYESDTDSALSSSQSSYLSKSSPPASPIHIRSDSANDGQKKNSPSLQMEAPTNYESLNRRLLKPQSLEAINRKNILASARCRSGRDLKVGSPLIQRKFEDTVVNVEEPKTLSNGNIETKHMNEERQTIKVKSVIETKSETPKTEELPIAKAIGENLNLPKVVLRRDIESILTDKPIEHSKRNFGVSGYYSQHYPIIRRASSVTDLRRNFEKIAPTPAKRNSINSIITSTQPLKQPQPIKRTSLPQIIPPTNQIQIQVEKPTNNSNENSDKNKYDKLIDDAIKQVDETIPKSDVKVVNLKPDVDGGSLGITLAGGVDYETKEITIHKIRDGSPAFRDGRLQKGDKILAINGKYMKGLSHAQSLQALKENVPEITIIACKGNDNNNLVTVPKAKSRQISSETTKEIKMNKDDIIKTSQSNEVFEVSIIKDETGLGFSIQGGKASPQGDVPLVIKKIFMGGAAENVVNLKSGDELLTINNIDVTSMSRREAWNLMKELPKQEVIIKVRR